MNTERPCKRDGRWSVCKNRKRWKTAPGYLDDPRKIVASTGEHWIKYRIWPCTKKKKKRKKTARSDRCASFIGLKQTSIKGAKGKGKIPRERQGPRIKEIQKSENPANSRASSSIANAFVQFGNNIENRIENLAARREPGRISLLAG